MIYGDYIFDEPVPLANWEPPYQSGIYAVLAFEPLANPRPFKVIHFGQSGNMLKSGFLRSQKRYPCWIRYAGSIMNLYMVTCPMPNTTAKQRKAIEKELIAEYKPICN